jgi:hypothetical protein
MTILMMRAGTTARLTLWLHVFLMHLINKDVHRFLSLALAQQSSSVFGSILKFRRDRQLSRDEVRMGIAPFGLSPHMRYMDCGPELGASKPRWAPGHGMGTWTKKRSSAPTARV